MPARVNRAVAAAVVAALALSALLVPPALGSPAKAPPDRWTARPADYGVVAEMNVPIEMSDGVVLYADVIRPADENGTPVPGRFPVILTQTPYNKNSSLNFRSDYLVSRGYVQVIVDVRGTGSSEGAWDSFGEREQKDGAELVDWAASPNREWSNGSVALYGTSYAAINQIFTAAQHPEGLKAAFPIVPMSDAYRDITVSGGQINTSFIPLWLGLVTGTGMIPPSYAAEHPDEAAAVLAQHAVNVTNFQAPAVADSMQGGDHAFDGAFYRTRSPIEVIDKVNVPTFISGGWFDLFQRGEPLLFQHLEANGVPTKLLMGPWYHITAGQGLPADGVPTEDELALRWFDHYVQGRPDPGLARMPDVTYYRLGDGHYHTAPSWPPPGVDYRRLYLSGPASPGAPGSLATTPPAKQDPDTLPWQPASGVCTRSTVQWSAGAGAGEPCETNDSVNDDTGLAYDLPLPADVDVAGPISAHLFVGTNGHDGMLTVRVEDVAPDGSSSQLTAGWNVLSLRALDKSKSDIRHGLVVRPYHPFTKQSALPVEDGKIYDVWVEVFPTAALLAKGDSLRVSITPSDAPHLSPPVPQAASSAGGVLSLYHDAAHPSEVVVPVERP